MATLDELVIRIRADSAQLEHEMRKAGTLVQSESKKMERSFAGLTPAAAGAAKALVAVFTVRAMAGIIRDIGETERRFLRLQGVLRATGNAAGMTASQIKSIADEIERTTLFKSDEVMEAAAALATYDSIMGETFQRTLKVSTDMAEVFGQSIKSASEMVAKALDDPIEGLGALRRVGFTFAQEQENVIRALMETGKLAEAQRVILRDLENQMSGTAQTAAGGLTGSITRLGTEVRKLTEDLAAQFAEGINLIGMFDKMAQAASRLREAHNRSRGNYGALSQETLFQAGAQNSARIHEVLGKINQLTSPEELKGMNELQRLGRQDLIDDLGRELKQLTDDAAKIDEAFRKFEKPPASDVTAPPVTGKAKGATGGAKTELQRLPEDYDEARRSLDRLIDSMRDEIELMQMGERQRAIEIEVRRAQKAEMENENSLTLEQIALIEELAAKKYDLQEAIQRQNEAQRQAAETAREWQREMADGLTDIIMNFDSATGAAKQFFDEIARNLLRKHVTGPLSEGISGLIGGMFGGGSSGGVSSSGRLVGVAYHNPLPWLNGFADGGNPPVGRPSIVGERGPEIFVPRVAGTVIPNHQMGGTSVTVVQHNSFGAGVSRAELAGMLPAIANAAKEGVYSDIRRGGSAAQLVGRRN